MLQSQLLLTNLLISCLHTVKNKIPKGVLFFSLFEFILKKDSQEACFDGNHFLDEYDSCMDKQTLRAQMKWICASIDAKQRQSREICEALLVHPKVRGASTMAVYEAFDDEVSLELIIKEFQWTKRILIPHKDHEYCFVHKDTKEKYQWEIDVILIPWRAFTCHGARLWRGGGWYDRVLGKYQGSYLLGVCFVEQLVATLPVHEHDVMMNEVVSGVK